MSRNVVMAPGAATAGPYSHAVWSGDLLYLSGQTPVNPVTRQLVDGDIGVQVAQCFANLFAVLHEAGLTPEQVTKVNVFLTDINDFAAMNEVYRTQFEAPFPARTTIGVAALPLGARVEIELIARRS
jgi:2-iminobutanoate/2-iminopropanoate deaminase